LIVSESEPSKKLILSHESQEKRQERSTMPDTERDRRQTIRQEFLDELDSIQARRKLLESIEQRVRRSLAALDEADATTDTEKTHDRRPS
jgi:hypothetical protein